MKSLLFLACLIPTVAFAHDADKPCRPDQITEDGCQPVLEYLCLDKKEFFDAHKDYWHGRRSLNKKIQTYASYIAKNQQLQWFLGEPVTNGVAAIINYWDVIPAHPELDFRCDVEKVKGQTRAANETAIIVDVLTWFAQSENEQLGLRLWGSINKSPLCCDKKKKNCKPC